MQFKNTDDSSTEGYSDEEMEYINIEDVSQSSDSDEVNYINYTYDSSSTGEEESNSEHNQYSEVDDDEMEYVDVPLSQNSSKQFIDECIDKLSNREMWTQIVRNLDKEKNLNDFMTFIQSLYSGDLPMDNIVFLLLLERAKFSSLENTVGMRYRKVTKLFWSIVYRLCKSTGLKFFSGSKNWGQVVSNVSERSRYDGSNSKINFAVPDERILRCIKSRLPKVIPPGKIQQSIDLLAGE